MQCTPVPNINIMLWERKILLEKEMQVWTSVGEGAPGCVGGANPFPWTARHV